MTQSYGIPSNDPAVFESMDRFFDSLTSNPELEVTINAYQTYPDGITFFNDVMVPAGGEFPQLHSGIKKFT